MRLDWPKSLVGVGVAAQVHGQHLPLTLSGMLIAGGLALGTMERYWERQAARENLDRGERILDGACPNGLQWEHDPES